MTIRSVSLFFSLVIVGLLLAACADANSESGDNVEFDASSDLGRRDVARAQDIVTLDVNVEDTGAEGPDVIDVGDTSDPVDVEDTSDPVDVEDTTDTVDVEEPPDCPLGHPCNPIQIDQLPYQDSRNTNNSTSTAFDGYSCAPQTDESGSEFVYVVDIATEGTLTVSVDDVSDDGVDIDVHILDAPETNACLARNNKLVSVRVQPGVYYIVADTWVNSSGNPLPGPYTLNVAFLEATTGDCSMDTEPIKMFWSSCDGSLDCFEGVDSANGQTYRWLRLPAIGPVVKEAHLVTTADDFGGGWPNLPTEQIAAHYILSEAASGYSTARTEPWAPDGEGGSEYGQGSTGGPIPVLDEAWYINMYWRNRPAGGTRMIVQNPANGRTVVASAGYETGPGSNTAVAGVAEEIHNYLGTSHRDDLLIGFAVDQNLSLGPIECP